MRRRNLPLLALFGALVVLEVLGVPAWLLLLFWIFRDLDRVIVERRARRPRVGVRR